MSEYYTVIVAPHNTNANGSTLMARLATLRRTGKRLLYANFTGEVTSDIELCDISCEFVT